MSKPFTGTVTERTEIPFETHCAWDIAPSTWGLNTIAEPGPAVKELQRKRGKSADGE